MLILVINCGSSSAKYRLFDIASYRSLSKGMIERIGRPGNCRDHYDAIGLIVKRLTDKDTGVISSVNEISGVGHRVVHGGEEFKSSTLITRKVVASIEKYSELAPLHNPPSLLGIKACMDILKGIPQVAVFDTSFHQTMPEEAFLYALPYKYYRKYGIRRYGFHGTSHRYVAMDAAKELGRPLAGLKMITCHLGNGCSMTAVKNGKSLDTSMGFTPLEGLIMGTRSGDLDPAVVFYLMSKEGFTPARISDILNKDSGLLGISGVSNDMRDLLKSAGGKGPGSARSRLALEMFIYRIEKYIGAYQAAMKGLDAIVFTAGIGEHNPWLVNRVKKDLKNVVGRKTKVLTIPTNEELLIARDACEIIRRNRK
jgi:acetate kinase